MMSQRSCNKATLHLLQMKAKNTEERTLDGRGTDGGGCVEGEELLVEVLGFELCEFSLELVFVDGVAKRLRNGIADLCRDIHLLSDLVHCVVHSVDRPE